MTHVRTIIFIPKGERLPVSVRVYTEPKLTGASPEGYFVSDAGVIILSSKMYGDLKSIRGDQAMWGKFVNNLQVITLADIQKQIV